MTLTIILAALLVVVSALCIIIVVRWHRKSEAMDRMIAEVSNTKIELEAREYALNKRQNEYELWEKQLKVDTKISARSKNIYANKTVEDPDNSMPDKPDKATYKKLASQFGYSAYKFFKQYVRRSHEDGKTTYSLDLNIYPFNE